MKISSYQELRTKLGAEADDEYASFSRRLIPTERPILGVRVPKVRELSKLIPQERIDEFLEVEPVALEELLARGFLICRLPYNEMVLKFDSQVDYIDDWCNCDTFCSSLRNSVKKHREEFLDRKIEKLLNDKREFAARIGLVLLKCYYVEPDYLALIFDRVEDLAGREEYYIRMAIAWLVAECFIKYPDETLAYMKVTKLPVWTYNKIISKICDSYRVDSKMKDVLRRMRK